jgi:predicted nucleic acid-binding protein
MTTSVNSLMVDCSVVVKWEIKTEPHAAEVRELLLDWQHRAIVIVAPNFLLLKTMNAIHRAQRGARIAVADAGKAVTTLLALAVRWIGDYRQKKP